ncbi:hypothetical protein dsat_2369 [Alkalidesulfovibrio alkalitolerans DSM 16529]|uniref:Uncharacterized protein n=1 Tax=Alkalidesulfovibrio alkalitolerans DSM 16529 TaxID=1121439 RepID=S7TE83_9BACT|nr:hypothetical protein [Alkalidesulfovibrio alkalitolerans]EPR35006.1 hypothetical protein dsat_2369 [Alkalidesulfovibrio alkalitolerans DSM 16529]
MRQGNMGQGFGRGGKRRGNMAGQCRFGSPVFGGAQDGRQDQEQGFERGQGQGFKRRGVFSVTPAASDGQTDAAGQPEVPESVSATPRQTDLQGDRDPTSEDQPAPGAFGQGGRCRMLRRRDGSCRGLGR